MTATEVDRRGRFTQLKRDVAERQAQVVALAEALADGLIEAGLSTSVGHRATPFAALNHALIALRAAEDALAAFCDAEQTAFREGK